MQNITFSHLVEQVQQLALDEKQVLWELLEKYLQKERRNAIYKSYQEAQEVEEHLTFSSDIEQLKKQPPKGVKSYA